MILHQRLQAGLPLVIGGMGFINKSGCLGKKCQVAPCCRFVFLDKTIAKFHPRLHHQRQHPFPGGFQPGFNEGCLHDLESPPGSLHRGNADPGSMGSGTARDGHLRADHITQAGGGCGLFRAADSAARASCAVRLATSSGSSG